MVYLVTVTIIFIICNSNCALHNNGIMFDDKIIWHLVKLYDDNGYN